jgi:RNA polymerase sigma-70 factor (ECF subfamily)
MLRRVHDPTASLEDIVDRLDRVRLVQSLLDSMTPEQREAVTLQYVEQFSVSEIARIMGRSEKAVERLLERAKERPRQEMFKWFGEESFRMLCFDLLTL